MRINPDLEHSTINGTIIVLDRTPKTNAAAVLIVMI